ncbi:MAG: glucosyl transferase [Ignavibacteriales bacterium]|nr:MAG: glucosyl transferase [Ignavibacteriales bacterium]
MKNYFFLIPPPRMLRRASFILLLFSIPSCKEDTPVIPPPPQPKITLTVDDVSCTEAWLNLKLENITLPVDLELKKDSTVVKTFLAINSNDTSLYVDSLLPNQTYNFVVSHSGLSGISSNVATTITMDTTSHNFTWQTFEFGQHSSSILYDVAIIDENNIWAVGEIFMNDSLGNPDPHAYNAVHWNGNQWEVKKISVLFRGNLITPPLYGIFALTDNEIWLSSGVPIKGDGINWTQYHLFDTGILTQQDGYLTKIWGSSSSNIYFVGTLGTIAHYNGSQWTKIESGITLDLTDIYSDAGGNVYAAGVNIAEVKGVVLEGNSNQFSVKITGEIIDESELFISKLYGSFGTIWVDENGTIYTGGNLMYQFNNNHWDYVRSLPENFLGGNPGSYYRGYISTIRGNASNDIVIAGGRNTLKHFNGISWQQLGLPYSPSSVIRWAGLSMKDNKLVAAGGNGNKAFVMLLLR